MLQSIVPYIHKSLLTRRFSHCLILPKKIGAMTDRGLSGNYMRIHRLYNWSVISLVLLIKYKCYKLPVSLYLSAQVQAVRAGSLGSCTAMVFYQWRPSTFPAQTNITFITLSVQSESVTGLALYRRDPVVAGMHVHGCWNLVATSILAENCFRFWLSFDWRI